MDSKTDKYLRKLYLDPESPASFQGPQMLYNTVKKDGKYKIKLKDIKHWMQNLESYSLNKRLKRSFHRGRVVVNNIDDQWDADLAFMDKYSKDNKGMKYLFCAIDIFSRFAWVVPIKEKTEKNIVDAFAKILNRGRKPRILRTDGASDFTSGHFQNFIHTRGIHHFTTHNEKQANYVERFIKTIKNKLMRYMTEMNTDKYIDVLPKLVSSYNNTEHSTIKIEPSNVSKTNERQIFWNMYKIPRRKPLLPVKKFKRKKFKKIFSFNVGDKVRISRTRKSFEREYDEKWSREIFIVTEKFYRQNQPLYKIEDWFNERIKGTFYPSELQKVNADNKDLFTIGEKLEYKGRGQNRQVLVSWLGWPKKFDSWIYVKDVKDG